MAQSILDVSLEDFVKELPKIDWQNLKSLLRGIYMIKWERGKTLGAEQIMDLERKETKIWAELQRRNILIKKNYEDFHRWLNDLWRHNR